MKVIGLYVIYHKVHKRPVEILSFDVTDIEGSVLLSCVDTLTLGLVLVSYKLDTKLLSHTKIVICHTDRSDVFAINRKIQGTNAEYK